MDSEEARQKADDLGKKLREAGWPIKTIWISEDPIESKIPAARRLLLLTLERPLHEEALKKLHLQANSPHPWIVVFDCGAGLVGLYSVMAMAIIKEKLQTRPPQLVWETLAAARARTRESESRKPSDTLGKSEI